MSDRILHIFPELEFRLFSPAELKHLAGVSPENQRIWRHRYDVEFDADVDDKGERLLQWGQVMQWALMVECRKVGITLKTAARIAGSRTVEQLGWHDHRRIDRAPLFLFYRLSSKGKVAVTTGAGRIDFNTGDAFWSNFGSWFNYSLVQRKTIELYEAGRKPVHR